MKPFTHEDIPGWFDFADFYLEMLDRARPGDIMVELGVWLGKSTIFMAQEAMRRKLDVQIYAVDIFDDTSYNYTESAKKGIVDGFYGSYHPRLKNQFLIHIFKARVDSLIRIKQCDSADAAKSFKDGSVRFVFVDADHEYDAVCRDIDAWLPKLTPDGLIAGHDIAMDGVRRAVAGRIPNYKRFGSCWVS